ncbi:TetR/AcrR family transcriptional regulator C-terminal domain-containing protein [Actinomadura sp. HBU206391]|uniref:TetR/AcrR family transcriptional regulator C-terminal domain-containing protein n=1 Tax=Actinomadura sp. HBU206391 TaxID=2731692 RepID=UPI00164F93CD|nr:TetR/AcrR family transcriptional regulator C-terminal domain-containing protein [Actinomadura sp. HBU206391]MBC6459995.1 TetR/AcrR family transcriptional regulator C-terminal domain-containing protein [Actinomadura sp. HBU206391]
MGPAEGDDELTAETGRSADQRVPVPPWRKPRKAAPPKQPLSQEAILETALRVLRAEGLDAVTMRRVAQELGTGPASLYAHVSNKDELLELMLDHIAAEISVPEPDPARWQEQIKEVAREARRVWSAYADISRVSLGNIPTGPNQLTIAEGQLAIMRAGGVPDQIAAWFVDRLGLFIDADALEGSMYVSRLKEGWDAERYFGQIREYYISLPRERFPLIVSMTDTLMTGGDEERFEFGLDLMVRGLASYVTE